MSAASPILTVADLTVSLGSGVPIVQGISLELKPGQILGIVGESGSGKSTLALALLGYAQAGTRIANGSVTIQGEQMVGRRPRELRRLRGRVVSYVPQDPSTSLNPSARIGRQVEDRLIDRPREKRAGLIRRALERAQLPIDDTFLERFPHQLSGGQQQRSLIAMAIAGSPPLIVLDEPTTGLDVITQAGLLREILDLRNELGVAVIYVSHDIAAVATVVDLVAVMYAGRIVESGPIEAVLRRPRHPYTRGLVESVPDPKIALRLGGLAGTAVAVGEWPSGCPFAPRCAQVVTECGEAMPGPTEIEESHIVRCFREAETPPAQRSPKIVGVSPPEYPEVLSVRALSAGHRSRYGEVVAADDVSFSVGKGECVALVGQSGSGKTTIARCIAGLHAPTAGSILLHGRPLAPLAVRRQVDERRRIQIVFQNPYESLNPRHRVGETVMRPAITLAGLSRNDAIAEMHAALERVGLPSRIALRYPTELSGGERQRVAVARALAARPEALVCDEITSALDVSVQGVVLDLLSELRQQLGVAMLFISHDLGVVASVADRVLILDRGQICESGPVATVLANPQEPYTRELLEAAPRLDYALPAAPFS